MPQWSTDIVAFRIWESCLFEESVCGNFGSQLSGCPRNQTEISLAGWLILHRGAIRGDLHAASCWVSSTSLLLLVPLAPGQRIGSLLLCDRLSDRQLVAVACSFRDSLYRTWKSQTQDVCVCNSSQVVVKSNTCECLSHFIEEGNKRQEFWWSQPADQQINNYEVRWLFKMCLSTPTCCIIGNLQILQINTIIYFNVLTSINWNVPE